MAHTYINLQPSFATILKDVVQSTSDAIESEIGYTVKYKHNSFEAIVKELSEESAAPSTQNDRYPLIALMQPFTAVTKGRVTKVNCDVIILMDTDPHKSSDEREVATYNPILRPIAAELLTQLSECQYFGFDIDAVNVSHKDIYHVGGIRGGKNGYDIPDFCDAIILEGLEVDVWAANECLEASAECVPMHDVELKDYIQEVALTSSTGLLNARISSAVYVNADDQADTVSYSINWGDGGSDIDTSIGVTKTKNLEALADGVYIGTISSSYGATYQFEYQVRSSGGSKTITSITAMSETILTEDLDCNNYFAYPNTIFLAFDSTGAYVNAVQIMLADGNIIHDNSYTNTQNGDETHIESITQLLNSYTIILLTSNGNSLENKTILNLKNI